VIKGLLRDAGTHVCHIGWTVRQDFYARLGEAPWWRYRMSRRPLGERREGWHTADRVRSA